MIRNSATVGNAETEWCGAAALARKDIKGLFLVHRQGLQTYLANKVRDAETARDLTQETFLRFAERSRGEGAAAILNDRSYLYRTAHNLAVDHIRQQQHEQTRPAADEDLVDLPDTSPTQDQSLGGQEELARLQAILMELPERTRQVFAAVRIEGLTGRQAAARLGISDSSVEKHLAKAIKHVMQRLRSP